MRSAMPGSASQGSPARSGSSAAAQARCAPAISGFAGVEHRVLEAPGEEALRVRDQVLVEGVGAGDQRHEPRSRARPTRPLRCQLAICEPG